MGVTKFTQSTVLMYTSHINWFFFSEKNYHIIKKLDNSMGFLFLAEGTDSLH
jgi:hypothetical protein